MFKIVSGTIPVNFKRIYKFLNREEQFESVKNHAKHLQRKMQIKCCNFQEKRANFGFRV